MAKNSRNKYEPIYTFDTKIPFKKLIKGSLIINFAPILIITIFVINGGLQLPLATGLAVAIFLLSLLFIYPYMADLQELTEYVKNLVSDKKAKRPSLSFLGNVEELSTEIEKLNNSWDNKNKRLKTLLNKEMKTQQMLQDFVANASHEMKTPLASIKGFTETISGMSKKSKKEEEFLQIIKEQSERLEHLINELLLLSKLESDEKRVQEEIDPEKIITSIENSLSLLIKEKQIKFSYELPKKLPKIMANKNDVTRALENLLTNAIKYNDKGTKIDLIVKNINKIDKKLKPKLKGNKYIKISVKDNGKGIEKSELPRLTERFYRVDKARSRKIGGSGLGLSIVKQIALNHNGYMDVKSTVGKGSEFIIYLPAES